MKPLSCATKRNRAIILLWVNLGLDVQVRFKGEKCYTSVGHDFFYHSAKNTNPIHGVWAPARYRINPCPNKTPT